MQRRRVADDDTVDFVSSLSSIDAFIFLYSKQDMPDPIHTGYDAVAIAITIAAADRDDICRGGKPSQHSRPCIDPISQRVQAYSREFLPSSIRNVMYYTDGPLFVSCRTRI